MLEHVLVPLDGSQLAEEALEYARKIVDASGKLTLLTVVDVPDLPVYYYYPTPIATRDLDRSAVTDELVPQARDYLEKIAANLSTENYKVDIEVQVGEAAGVITTRAEELGVDAISICTHGRSGIERWLFGSVTNKVLSTATCPVFVIPGRRLAKQAKEEATAKTTAPSQ